MFADGRSNGGGGMTCGSAAAPYAGEHVLDLDLAGIAPDDDRRRHALGPRPGDDRRRPDSGSAAATYPAGSRWGSFTIALSAGPAR